MAKKQGAPVNPCVIPEASRRLKISDYRTRQMILRGELRGWKIGAEWRVDADEVDRLARGETDEAAA